MRPGKWRAHDRGSDLRPLYGRSAYRGYRERPMELAVQGFESRHRRVMLGAPCAVSTGPSVDIDRLALHCADIGNRTAGNLRCDRNRGVE